jgi:hypothetical protein
MTLTVPELPAEIGYSGADRAARWAAYVVHDEGAFRQFLDGTVRDRLRDADLVDGFEEELRGLATTGMASEFLERLLNSVPANKSWEIGEALAECILEKDTERDVVWPWNSLRDRRSPRASLPGADLVGFCRQGDGVLLLFGEVKTSSDKNAPPGVMYGGSGMTWQLAANATRLDVQCTLLKWLRSRCQVEEHIELYRRAVGRYLCSEGKEILIVGVLLRDTDPDERDVKSRACALADDLTTPTQIEVVAWYLPISIRQWAAVIQGGAR